MDTENSLRSRDNSKGSMRAKLPNQIPDKKTSFNLSNNVKDITTTSTKQNDSANSPNKFISLINVMDTV